MSKIFIDAGHGGTETGAIGHGIIEKNINLVVALEVKRILALNGQTVKMSRETDLTIGLTDRCTMSNQWGADYFISIHHNANDGATNGTEIYSSVTGGKGTELALSIAKVFQNLGRHTACIQRDSESNPGQGQDYYAVIRQPNAPAIITEAGYIDSGDYINFDTAAELQAEARQIAEGILTYLGVTNIQYTNTQVIEHWAQAPYEYLKSKGIKIYETRFDDKITRGEVFARKLYSRILRHCQD